MPGFISETPRRQMCLHLLLIVSSQPCQVRSLTFEEGAVTGYSPDSRLALISLGS